MAQAQTGTYKDLKQAYNETFDMYDPWGSNTAGWFTVSNELAYRGEHVPWEYHPGMGVDPREEEEHVP